MSHSPSRYNDYEFDTENDIENEIGLDNSPPMVASTQSTSKPRRKSSYIWDHFHQHPEIPDKVICKHCNNEYVHRKGSGLGTLERHFTKNHNKKENTTTDLRQSKLQIGSSENIINWK